MNKTRLLVVVGAITCIIITIMVANSSSSKAQQATQQFLSGATPSIVDGIAAIPVRVAEDPVLKVKGARFTSDDAIKYVSSHQVARTLPPSSIPTGDTANFMTSQEASTLLNGETIGIPDSWLVCFVSAHGSFSVPGSGSRTLVFHKVIEVFDAGTGNLLLVTFQS